MLASKMWRNGKNIVLCFCLVFLSRITLNAQDEIFGLAQPIQLELDSTVIYLSDYFTDVSVIKSVDVPEELTWELSADKSMLRLYAGDQVPVLSNLTVTTSKATYTILLRKSKKERVLFKFDPKGKAYSKVSIVGDLTGWNPNVIFFEKVGNNWQTELVLSPGRYQYQIVADGNWFLDPNNKNTIDNGIGGFNSLFVAGDKNGGEKTILKTQFQDGSKIGFQVGDENQFNDFIVLWNNTRIDVIALYDEEKYEESLFCIIPEEAATIKRSIIRAIAIVDGVETNDVLIPLEFGKVIMDPQLLEKDDFQRSIMYFMMVDRFKNGDEKNDAPVNDERLLPQANYYGGDLAGIQQKIDDGYFKSLGVNSLWISPVFQNPLGAYQEFPEPHRWFSGYHGYWPISLSKVDTRFGSNAIFKNLVTDAHGNDMSVYLDYVANHIHAEHPLWQAHPEWFSQLDLPDGRKNLRLWDEYRLTTWFEPYMPSFDHSQPAVAEACADSAMYWLNEFNLDGFRHDATKHIEIEFWRLLTYKIKTEIEIPQNKNIYQIGETFGSRELIGSYLGTGLLNAQFDFALYFDSRSVFANNDVSFERLNTSLFETFSAFGYHHVMGNITGNHDMARFISYASGDLKWNENDKEAGWNRKIDVTDTIGYAKLKMLHAFNATIPGIPITYYGDEIGMPGANDPDNRRMMRFDSLNRFELEVKQTVSSLNKLRSSHMALLYGDISIIQVTPGQYVYKRTYFDDVVYVLFNKENKPVEINIENMEHKKPYQINFGSAITQNNKITKVTLQPYSFEIITFKN